MYWLKIGKLMKLKTGNRKLTAVVSLAVLSAAAGVALAQLEGGPPMIPGIASQPAKNNDQPITIVQPAIDKQNHQITIPAAFWNQHMTTWVEVALCGRPSDFLHETIACVTTTKDILMRSMREAGFRDADFWVGNVEDFPRIRGDRALILLEFTQAGKKQTYALDELLTFQGWGVSAGPNGWMFKGDPERATRAVDQEGEKIFGPAATKPAVDAPKETPAAKDPDADRTRILRDDPQVALQFKGIQHLSQSFMDNPIAYENWVYPVMRFGRNYRLLTEKLYDSNGDVPVTLIIRKVTEEQFLTQIAGVWHDEKCREYILKQLPVAQQIDKDKAELEALIPEFKKLHEIPVEERDAIKQDQVFGKTSALAASIEKGYATLDGAWGIWAADHPVYEAENNDELELIKNQVKLWREHMQLTQLRAEQLSAAENAAYQQKVLSHEAQTPEVKAKIAHLRGVELEARSNAIIAGNKHPAEYWKSERSRLNPQDDPRTDWIRHVQLQVDMANAREVAAHAGITYGQALQSGADVTASQLAYAKAVGQLNVVNLQLNLADINFEISKRDGFDDDPELPALRKQKAALEARLKSLEAATQPAK